MRLWSHDATRIKRCTSNCSLLRRPSSPGALLWQSSFSPRAAGKKEGAEVGHRHRVGEQAGMSTSANQRLAGQVYMLWTYLWTYM